MGEGARAMVCVHHICAREKKTDTATPPSLLINLASMDPLWTPMDFLWTPSGPCHGPPTDHVMDPPLVTNLKPQLLERVAVEGHSGRVYRHVRVACLQPRHYRLHALRVG